MAKHWSRAARTALAACPDIASGKPQTVVRLAPDCQQVTLSADGSQGGSVPVSSYLSPERATGLPWTGKRCRSAAGSLHLGDAITGKERWCRWPLAEGVLTFSPTGKVLAYQQPAGSHLVHWSEPRPANMQGAESN